MKIEDIIRRYKKKIERTTEAMNDYKQSNNIELVNAVSVCENEIEEAELIISALELFKAKADGRLVALPCKVGDTVYTNQSWSGDYERSKDKPYSHRVVFIGINGIRNFFNTVNPKTERMFTFDFSDIGKTVFLTKEAAEKAMGSKLIPI